MSVLDALGPLFDQLLMLTLAALAVMGGCGAALLVWASVVLARVVRRTPLL